MKTRTIYIGDIHSSQMIKKFIEKYDDGNTIFISLGDLFDRGPNAYENFLIFRDLYSRGKFKMCLGNHDLFFLMGIGFSEKYSGFLLKQVESSKRYKDYVQLGKEAMSYFQYNGGEETLDSILERYTGLYGQKVSNLTIQEQGERLNQVAEFLFNFDIFVLDNNNSLLIHGGLPILSDGSLVNVDIKGTMTQDPLDYIYKFNELYRNLDYGVLLTLTVGVSSEYQSMNIYYDMKQNKMVKDIDQMDQLIYRLDTSASFIPTWFLNRYYFSNELTGKSLKQLLTKHQISRLIVGHDGNNIDESWFCDIGSDYWKHLLSQDNTLVRLDRSFLKKYGVRGNFGYAVFENNKFTKIGDSLDLLNEDV